MSRPGALVRARWSDLPVLAVIAGQAMSRRAFGGRLAWVLGVAGWPLWFVMLVLQRPHLWCLRRRALISIRPPDASRLPAAHLVLLGPGAVGALIGMSWILARPVSLALIASLGAGLLVYACPYPGRLLAGPKVQHAAPPVRVATAASIRRGTGLLDAACDLVWAHHPGAPLELVARDEELVVLYAEHCGVAQVAPHRGRMIGVVPT